LPTDSQIPILVLLDLRLPKVDGIEVLRQARNHSVWKQVPIVVLTTSRENKDIEAAYQLGVSSYIVKPVDFLAFAEVVKTIKVYWLLTNEPPFRQNNAGNPRQKIATLRRRRLSDLDLTKTTQLNAPVGLEVGILGECLARLEGSTMFCCWTIITGHGRD
jgi:CheY-like chemotaxis protein